MYCTDGNLAVKMKDYSMMAIQYEAVSKVAYSVSLGV